MTPKSKGRHERGENTTVRERILEAAFAAFMTGDPLQDITELQRVKFVMKGGVVFKDELRKSACAEQHRSE